jgi:hypothetical protein
MLHSETTCCIVNPTFREAVIITALSALHDTDMLPCRYLQLQASLYTVHADMRRPDPNLCSHSCFGHYLGNAENLQEHGCYLEHSASPFKALDPKL